jgi:hypothetical protein
MIKPCVITEIRGNKALVSADNRSILVKLKNRRIWVQECDDGSIQIDTTLLIDPSRSNEYRSAGFSVAGRIAKNTVRFSEEAFASIATCYLFFKETL